MWSLQGRLQQYPLSLHGWWWTAWSNQHTQKEDILYIYTLNQKLIKLCGESYIAFADFRFPLRCEWTCITCSWLDYWFLPNEFYVWYLNLTFLLGTNTTVLTDESKGNGSHQTWGVLAVLFAHPFFTFHPLRACALRSGFSTRWVGIRLMEPTLVLAWYIYSQIDGRACPLTAAC